MDEIIARRPQQQPQKWQGQVRRDSHREQGGRGDIDEWSTEGFKGRHGSANRGNFESGQNRSKACSYI